VDHSSYREWRDARLKSYPQSADGYYNDPSRQEQLAECIHDCIVALDVVSAETIIPVVSGRSSDVVSMARSPWP
jgi:hypothetical protein